MNASASTVDTAPAGADCAVAPPADAGPLFGRGRLGACVGAIALVAMFAFEAMAVAAAMPAVAEALDGVGLYALAFGGLLATSVFGMVLAGRWTDRHGALPVTLAGLLVFSAGLLLAGFAADMPQVVAGRIVQGFGGGMLGVTLYVGMGQLVPSPLHPRLFAMMAAAWVLPALVGPPVAAWLVERQGWRAVFLAVAAIVPVASLLLLPAFARLPRPAAQADADGRAGIAWAALAAAGALMLHAAGRSGASATGLPALLVGLAAALLAAARLLPRGALTARAGLPAVIALRGLLASAFASAEVFVPLYLTRAEGWSLAEAGLTLSAGAVMWSAGSALQARLPQGPLRRRGLQAGFVALAVGIGVVALQAVVGATPWAVVAGWATAGFGIGLAFPMLSVLTLSLSPPDVQGRNASALQVSDALASSAVLAVAGALLASADAAGPHAHAGPLGLAAAVAFGGALLAPRAFR